MDAITWDAARKFNLHWMHQSGWIMNVTLSTQNSQTLTTLESNQPYLSCKKNAYQIKNCIIFLSRLPFFGPDIPDLAQKRVHLFHVQSFLECQSKSENTCCSDTAMSCSSHNWVKKIGLVLFLQWNVVLLFAQPSLPLDPLPGCSKSSRKLGSLNDNAVEKGLG